MTSAEEKVVNLEDELRVAHELLYLVLDKIGEPVVLNVADSKERMLSSRAIDLAMDEEAGTWTLRVVDID